MMPHATRLGFSADNRLASVFDIPRLTLRKGERVRLVVLEETAMTMLRHWVDGVGYVECRGTFEIIKDIGTDAEHCPLCAIASAVRNSGMPSMPKRSFINVIMQYLVDSKGVPMQPVAAQMKVWVYGEDKFGMLINAAQEWGDLRQHDLQVTCTEETYQRFEMTIAKSAFWLQNDETRKRIAELYKQERPKDEDLMRVLGRSLELAQLQDIVKRVRSGQLGAPQVQIEETAIAEVGDTGIPEIDGLTSSTTLPEEVLEPSGSINFDDLLKL